ncbi:hypothetical protein [uncultured Lutibacter sp.]|mgnify:CR=1 FL=1|uniref:hypothetical protein n=1 Tax=uncultured Lutibacter sp. TaxID=437739 RepID=UPI002603DC35|nr:hypothetical protein [uncultured Lutibacter sp.]
MKKLTVLGIALIAFIGSINAQKSKLAGSWLLTKTEVGTEIQNPYQNTNFNEDGTFVIMGIEVGTWEYNKSKNAVVMKSDFDKDFNGVAEILNLNDNELILSKDGVKMFYTKMDMAKVMASNKNSGLLGMWEFKDLPYAGANTFFTFTEPDEYTIIQKEEGMTGTFKGTWIFDEQEKSLIIIGFSSENVFRGKNNIAKVDEETIELNNNGTVFKGVKKAESNIKIERLTFSNEDFYKEDGDYKYYDDEQKLPWNDSYKMMIDLANVKQLVYNYSTLLNGTSSFETKTLTANVVANVEEGILSIDNIFKGYDSYNFPEDTAMPTNNYDEYNKLFPLDEDIFRVVGEEEITVTAGTFNCTVIEAAGSFDEVLKVWMINDKPGIIAKVIKDNPDESFGHYYIFELQEIK